ncbi:ankyrin repeat domain-containing protein [Candidatus Odyssella thessalonicensis]|uniref:ankyrin repeat domain-containing protein n=1 Tax=Candidatus Odyssella thessalonicensis TaxID=84647 RepID=UPI000225ABFB|nr:ankyrin repeat domain-containing protein [Candidatus Odyssella thessalonicensis]
MFLKSLLTGTVFLSAAATAMDAPSTHRDRGVLAPHMQSSSQLGEVAMAMLKENDMAEFKHIMCQAKTDKDLNYRDENGYSLLHVIAELNLTSAIRSLECYQRSWLIKNINATTPNGITPLHLAAGQGKQDMISDLCTYGADIFALTSSGVFVLELALNYVEGQLHEDNQAGICNGFELMESIISLVTKRASAPDQLTRPALSCLALAIGRYLEQLQVQSNYGHWKDFSTRLDGLFTYLHDLEFRVIIKEKENMNRLSKAAQQVRQQEQQEYMDAYLKMVKGD